MASLSLSKLTPLWDWLSSRVSFSWLSGLWASIWSKITGLVSTLQTLLRNPKDMPLFLLGIGKSLLLALHAIHTARGTHPYRQVAPVPVRILVVGESWEQMDGLLELLWALLPKHEIDPKVSYTSGAGFAGYKRPHVRFVAGPGAGSVIYFATYRQGSRRIAGGKYHLIILDEPPPAPVVETKPAAVNLSETAAPAAQPKPGTGAHDILASELLPGRQHAQPAGDVSSTAAA